MQKDIDELSEAWKIALDSDLVKAAKDWGEYSPDAQAIIEIEARKRGLWEKILALRGEKINEPISKESSVSNTKEKEKPILDIVVKWGGVAILFVLSRLVGSISITVLFFTLLFAFIIGGWLARWYFNRLKVNQTFIKVIVWSNVLTWIVPYLGIFTGSATLEFSNLVVQEKKKYKILAIISIGLSLINALANIIIYYSQMKLK